MRILYLTIFGTNDILTKEINSAEEKNDQNRHHTLTELGKAVSFISPHYGICFDIPSHMIRKFFSSSDEFHSNLPVKLVSFQTK